MKLCHLIGPMDCHFRPDLEEKDTIIAVDGGYTSLKSWEIDPHLAIGDFDSLGYVPKIPNLLHLPREKDETDMEYALKFACELEHDNFLLQGGLGGRLDHSVANFHLLYQLAQQGKRGILMGEEQNITVIAHGSVVFPENMEGYVSVFPFSSVAEGIFLENLLYEGENLSLQPGVPLGVSNEFLPGKSAKITVTHGAVQIMWHGTFSQSHYMRILSGISQEIF